MIILIALNSYHYIWWYKSLLRLPCPPPWTVSFIRKNNNTPKPMTHSASSTSNPAKTLVFITRTKIGNQRDAPPPPSFRAPPPLQWRARASSCPASCPSQNYIFRKAYVEDCHARLVRSIPSTEVNCLVERSYQNRPVASSLAESTSSSGWVDK